MTERLEWDHAKGELVPVKGEVIGEVADTPVLAPVITPAFDDLNPAIQAMIMLYLTGHIPHETILTDQRLVRSPALNGSDKVEMVINGEYDPMRCQTTITLNVFINGVLTTPWTPWKEDPTNAS